MEPKGPEFRISLSAPFKATTEDFKEAQIELPLVGAKIEQRTRWGWKPSSLGQLGRETKGLNRLVDIDLCVEEHRSALAEIIGTYQLVVISLQRIGGKLSEVEIVNAVIET